MSRFLKLARPIERNPSNVLQKESARSHLRRLFAHTLAVVLAVAWDDDAAVRSEPARDQGKRTEARDLLVTIYGWFLEGLDTQVLQEAKALLDQLSSSLPRSGRGEVDW